MLKTNELSRVFSAKFGTPLYSGPSGDVRFRISKTSSSTLTNDIDLSLLLSLARTASVGKSMPFTSNAKRSVLFILLLVLFGLIIIGNF